jgi:hypothetical protein
MAKEDTQQEETSEQSGNQEQPPGPIPYERFKEVNERAKELEARLEKIEADQKAQREKELAKQNKWKELAEQREQDLVTERQNRLRLQVAAQTGIPVELADRIQGSDEEAMAGDAKRLLEFLKPAAGPGVPPSNPSSEPAALDITTMTPEEIRQNKAKLWG